MQAFLVHCHLKKKNFGCPLQMRSVCTFTLSLQEIHPNSSCSPDYWLPVQREGKTLGKMVFSLSLSTEKVRRCGVMDWNEASPLNCCFCGYHLALLRNWTWAAVCTGSGIRRCWFLHVFPIKLCGYKVTSPLARLQGVARFRPGAVWAGYLPLAGKRSCCADVFTVW